MTRTAPVAVEEKTLQKTTLAFKTNGLQTMSLQAVSNVAETGFLPDVKLKNANHRLPPAFYYLFCNVFSPMMAYQAGLRVDYLPYTYAVWLMQMLGTLGGYHRYFSHRGYKAGRIMTFFIGLLGVTGGQGGPLYWATHHRYHHRKCELVDDVHSPLQVTRESLGFLGFMCDIPGGLTFCRFMWAQGIYLLFKGAPGLQGFKLVPDWVKYPELVWLSKLASILFFGGGFLIYKYYGFVAFAYLFCLPTCLSFNCVQLVNSAAHLWGHSKYKSNESDICDARNIWWLTPVMLGANWHNNHHAQPNVGREGFEWYEIDPIYGVLKCLELFGLVWDIKQPKRHLLEHVDGEAVKKVD